MRGEGERSPPSYWLITRGLYPVSRHFCGAKLQSEPSWLQARGSPGISVIETVDVVRGLYVKCVGGMQIPLIIPTTREVDFLVLKFVSTLNWNTNFVMFPRTQVPGPCPIPTRMKTPQVCGCWAQTRQRRSGGYRTGPGD